MSNGKLDETDQKILEHLCIDARVSNREIAESMNLTEGTVRGRIKRMQSENMIRIMAIADVRVQTGYENPMMVYLGIHADLKGVKETAKEISRLPFIRFAATMLGRYDILAISFIGSNEELIEHINTDIMTIKGVRHVETKLAIKSLKYNYRWGRVIK
ncbi:MULTISPECIES: Lrp/AsnC family transcriptional regulator [unclassified Microbulbifer]|uniref:Lrp/AsnC family transcriptional regulator n=1 Tax=Microbulbifer spongiae TaxID=2944933 RepID=A0ABY9EEA3_9GAMM|nr:MULTISPECIES: Lrp/AsnC family transcriptional regulator [unclassified Microbulbifer]MDP5209256.1 Lrp/AsnC family transcriptional regulator [Microbulbifer sp. 2205BS26-8]WKD49071.1 Lrp/AsnC family transcriptional regulator [Microbulbifer sp. MI-G]